MVDREARRVGNMGLGIGFVVASMGGDGGFWSICMLGLGCLHVAIGVYYQFFYKEKA